MAKSATFGVMHLGIAFTVSLALTGSWTIAGAITIVEPIVNTVAHFFFDRWWDGKHRAATHTSEAGIRRAALPAPSGDLSTAPA